MFHRHGRAGWGSALTALVVLVAQGAPAKAKNCRSCSGLDAAGGEMFYEINAVEGQPLAAGEVRFYKRADEQCCLTSSSKTYPSVETLAISTSSQELVTRGIDGIREGGYTRGIMVYDLTSGGMKPVVSHVHSSMKCRDGQVFALVHAEPSVKRTRTGKILTKYGKFQLSVLTIHDAHGVQVHPVVSGPYLKKQVRTQQMLFSKGCSTLMYPDGKSKSLLSFEVPTASSLEPKTAGQKVRVAVWGNIVTCPTVVNGAKPAFPFEISFTVESLVPPGLIPSRAIATRTFKVDEKAFRGFNPVYLKAESPIQVVLEGSDLVGLKDFELVSVEHR